MNIIVLRGFSKAGKDTVGNILCECHGYTRVAFADSLKKMVASRYGCSVDFLHTHEGKEQICSQKEGGVTWRQVLIDESLAEKAIDPDIFAELTADEICNSASTRIVITDWRFPNELNVIQRRFPGASIKTVAVIRTDQIRSPVDDPSEYLLVNTPTDYTIQNSVKQNGLDALAQSVAALIRNE